MTLISYSKRLFLKLDSKEIFFNNKINKILLLKKVPLDEKTFVTLKRGILE